MYTDDPDVEAKHTDQLLTTQVIGAAFSDVISRASMNSTAPILVETAMAMVEDQECYVLPPCVQEVWRVAVYDEDWGVIMEEWKPRSEWDRNPWRSGFSLQGNMICFRPFPKEAKDFSILHTVNANCLANLGETGELETGGSSFILGTTLLGLKDRRINAYSGHVLRIITNTVIEERAIESYTPTTGAVTVRLPFTIAPDDDLTYEIVPGGTENVIEAVALRAAIKLGVIRKASSEHLRNLTIEYNSALKTLHDNLSAMQARTGKAWILRTIDNQSDG